MRDEPLDEQYLTWLYGLTGPVSLKNPSRTYWSLLRLLYTKEFAWFVPNDDNRVEDGIELRYKFRDECRIRSASEEWLCLPCSMLEMMIALSDRLSFMDGKEPADWFWELIENLGLTEYTDRSFFGSASVQDVESRLDVLNERTYAYSGHGGLFPLDHPEEDQRDVEILYQAGAYLLERA